VDAPNQGFKNPFAFERQMDNVLGFKTFYELKCLLIGVSLDETNFFIPYCLLYFSSL
jgi:hypothetical protein